MQVLSRNWKNQQNNFKEISEVFWDKEKIYLYINGLNRDDLILGKLRNSEKKLYGKIINLERNGKLITVAYFETKVFDSKLNSIWDFYITNKEKSKYRLKSKLDIENIPIYKLFNKNIQLQPYNTVQNNFSLRILKSSTITKVKDMYINNESINIDLDIFTDVNITAISILRDDDDLNQNFSIVNSELFNNYINNNVRVKYPLKEILENTIVNKSYKLSLKIKYQDETTEEIFLHIKNNFINDNVVFDGKRIYLYEKCNNIFIKYTEKFIEAQVKSIYSYSDKFVINGYIKYNLGNIEQVNNLLIVNRVTGECISSGIEISDKVNFKSEIYLNQLLNNNLIDGVWDLYLSVGNQRFRLESTNDDIENKQNVINIPQQMLGNKENTYVYKLYYSLQNELSLLIRKYINIKKIEGGEFGNNKLTLRGSFFVQPPLQELPKSIPGIVKVIGYYNKTYNFSVDVLTEKTDKKYYTNFNIDIDIKELNENEKKELKRDLLSNTIIFESCINGFKVKMIGVIDGKGLTEKTNVISNFINYNRRSYIKKSYKIFNKIVPINNNMAIYQSFHGKSFSCNPKAIHIELNETKNKYKGVWVLENEYTEVPKGTIIVKPNTLKYYYYMSRAKYFVNNGNFPDFYEKRKGTIHLQTWHGTPLKKLGFDISKNSPSYEENNSPELIRRNSRWDYLIGPNEYTSKILKRAFGFKREMLDVGYPRNDILHNYNDDKINKIKAKLGIGMEKKVILYAPTWRDSDFHGAQSGEAYKLKFDIDNFKKRFGDEYVLLLRLHYRDASRLELDLSDSVVINASFYDDIQELYLISNILITDYSSVMFDYANLKRVMIFYCYDYLKYKNEMRGCYFNFSKSAPGPIVFDEDHLFDAIDNSEIILEEYKENINNFYNKFCEWEDGMASNRIIEQVFKSIQ